MKNYIILDLEWNQAPRGREIKSMPFEIIEIGAVRLDENKTETDRFDALIKPQVYKTMHSINTMITNITMEELSDQPDFNTVYQSFINWCGDQTEFIFCTWGDMDLTELQRNIRHFNEPALSNGPMMFLDIQKLYSIYNGNPRLKTSLENAADELGINDGTPFHRAINDAHYTAKIFKKICSPELEKKVSYNLFNTPSDKADEIHAYFDTYSKYVTRSFPDRFKLLKEKDIWKNECYICRKEAETRLDWFSTRPKTFLNLSSCPEHGLLRSIISIKKDEASRLYAIKITHSASDEEVSQMEEKAKEYFRKNHKRLHGHDQKSNLSNSE